MARTASWNFVFTDIIARVSPFLVEARNLSVLLSDADFRKRITLQIQQSNTHERRDGRWWSKGVAMGGKLL